MVLCSDWAACVKNIESVTGQVTDLLSSSSLLQEIKGGKREKNMMTEYYNKKAATNINITYKGV